MSWLDNFDSQTAAQQMASSTINTQQTQLQNQQSRVTAQQKALTSLKTSLTDFQSVLKKLSVSGSSGGMVKNSATASQDGYVTLTANSSAKKGLYNISVKETASADMKAFEQLTDADIAAASGNLKVSVGEKEVDIDMSAVSTLAELRDKINAGSGGATASLVKQNGRNILMIGSEKSGASNAVTLTADDAALHDQLTQRATSISSARDAVISLGDGAMTFSSSTNTFKDVIPGVELTVIRKTAADEPLIVNVDNDAAGTRDQIKTFIDAYNKLRSQLDVLTRSGNADGSVARGTLAGDSGISMLENKLNTLLRTGFNGNRLADFGISADKQGQLQLDGDKFDKALKEDPAKFNALFDGKDGLLKRVQKDALDSFLSSTKGSLKQRQESIDRQNEQLTRKSTQIQTRYDSLYNRYLKQFISMKNTISQMNQTMTQF